MTNAHSDPKNFVETHVIANLPWLIDGSIDTNPFAVGLLYISPSAGHFGVLRIAVIGCTPSTI